MREWLKNWYDQKKKSILKWYNGERIPAKLDSKYELTDAYQEHSRSAKAVRRLVAFYLRHWQWIILTTIAVVALFVS